MGRYGLALPRSGAATLERAYELALSGQCSDLGQIKARLKAEGHLTVLTDLRSHIVCRELRALCKRIP